MFLVIFVNFITSILFADFEIRYFFICGTRFIYDGSQLISDQLHLNIIK
jgi:hypothetical protein